MSQKIPNSVLFNAMEIEISGDTYRVPRKFSGHQVSNRLDPSGNPTRVPGTYSIALLLYKYKQEGDLTLIASETGDKVYIEFPGKSVHKVYAENSNGSWTIGCNENRILSSVSEAVAVAAIAAVQNELFDPGIADDSPEYFCDSVYYNFANHMDAEDTEITAAAFKRLTEELFCEPGVTAIVGTVPAVSVSAKKKAAKKPAKTSIEDEYQKMLNGEYKLDYDWDARVKSNIPEKASCLETVPTKPLIKLAKLIKAFAGDAAAKMNAGEEVPSDDRLNIQCPGPVGSGKTLSVQVIGELTEAPTYLLTATPEDYADELTEGVTKFEGGEPVHRASVIAKWMEFGGILLIDEMVMGRPDQYFSALAQVLENPYHIYDDGVREIKRHPLAICIMAYNNGIIGGKTISQPLMSRFANVVRFDTQDRQVFIDALMNFMSHKDYPYDKQALAEWMYDAFNATVEYLKKSKASDALGAISLRACQGVLRQLQIGEEPKEALECLWGPVEHYTAKHGLALRDDIFPSLRDIESY